MDLNQIVQLLIILVLLGVAIWGVDTIKIIATPIKQMIMVLLVFVAVLFVMRSFGLLDGLATIRVRRHT